MNKSEAISNVLQKNHLFSSLSTRQIEELLPLVRVLNYEAGETIINENDNPVDLYIIWEGKVEILKKAQDETELCISKLQAGEVIGEIALLDDSPRSASVRATTSVKLLAIAIADLKTLAQESSHFHQMIGKLNDLVKEFQAHHNEHPTYYTLVGNLANTLSNRMRRTNEVTVASLRKELEETKTRVAMGKFMIHVLLLSAVYIYVFRIIQNIASTNLSTTVISVPLIIFYALSILFMMKTSGYPLRFYGLTLNNWKRATVEGIVLSIPLILFIVLTKWLLINLVPQFSHLSLINMSASVTMVEGAPQTNLPMLVALIIAYLIFTPIQELICRGALQSSLQEFLVGPGRVWWAIIMSNVLFSATHLHVSISLAVLVLIPGLYWGWMYARHKTLIGVSLSHLIVGGLAFFIFDIEGILQV